jgi:hypothetical protein
LKKILLTLLFPSLLFAGALRFFNVLHGTMGFANTKSIQTGIATNDYINFTPSTFSFENTTAFSVSTWMKVNSLQDYYGVWEKYDTSFVGYGLSIQPTGRITMFVGHNDTTNKIQVYTSDNTLALYYGRWAHVVVTYDGSKTAAGTNIYINGTLQTLTVGVDALTSTIINSAPFAIGYAFDVAHTFPANQSNLSVWNIALSQTQVNSLFNSGSPPDLRLNSDYASHCLSWYWLGNGDSSSTILDHKGNNTGTGVNLTSTNFKTDPANVFLGLSPTFWVDASAINQTNGGGISAWRSAGSVSAYLTMTNYPTVVYNAINGMPVVRFNGTNQWANTTINISNFYGGSALTEFIVFQTSAITGDNAANSANVNAFYNDLLIGDTYIGEAIFLRHTGPQAQFAGYHAPNQNYAVQTIAFNTPAILTRYYDGSTLSMKLNNGTANTAALASGLNTAHTMQLCHNGNNPSAYNTTAYAKADIAEIISYARVLNSTEISTMLAYLNAKYAVY